MQVCVSQERNEFEMGICKSNTTTFKTHSYSWLICFSEFLFLLQRAAFMPFVASQSVQNSGKTSATTHSSNCINQTRPGLGFLSTFISWSFHSIEIFYLLNTSLAVRLRALCLDGLCAVTIEPKFCCLLYLDFYFYFFKKLMFLNFIQLAQLQQLGFLFF